MIELRRKVLLPVFQLTEVCDALDPRAVRRHIKAANGIQVLTYYCRQAVADDGKTTGNYNMFPVVLQRDGRPWLLASYFLLDKLEGQTNPNMKTCWSLADDLGAFREWLDRSANPEQLLYGFP